VAYGSRVPPFGIGGFAMPGLNPYEKENIINAASKAISTKYLYPQLKDLKETQCGFKAYPRKILDVILDKTKDTTFSFDTELFIHARNAGAAIKEIGIFWSDSAAEASGTSVKERWRMFKSWIDQYRRLCHERTITEETLSVVEKLVDRAFDLAGQNKDTLEIAKKIVKMAKNLPKKEITKTIPNASYPAPPVVGNYSQRPVTLQDKRNFDNYINDIRNRETAIAVEKADMKGVHIAAATTDDKGGIEKVILDENLACFAPPYNNTKDESRAFSVFMDDIIRQTIMSAEGKNKWTVWEERANYFKEHPEEYLLLADLLTSGGYGLISNAPQELVTDQDYLTVLRINVNLRKLREAIERDVTGQRYPVARKYFERFNLLSPSSADWPERFSTPVTTNWAMTESQIEKAKEFFIKSAENIKLVNKALRDKAKKIKVAVVVGMHAEKSRLMPPSDEVPLGEDSLRSKVQQMEELCKDTNIDWELIFVAHPDSPDQSGKVAEEIAKKYYPEYYRSEKIRVIYITGPTVGKGGKVAFGLAESISGDNPADIAVYTDADVTVDIRQTALLLRTMLLDENNELRLNPDGSIKDDVAAYGSRVPILGIGGFAMPGLDPSPYAEENVVNAATKAVNKNYLFAPVIRGYKETQCGFKAYTKGILEKILPRTEDTTFAFDTELFTHTLSTGANIKEIGIFWSDSSAEASGTNVKERWRMFKQWIIQYRKLCPVKTIPEDTLNEIEALVDKGFDFAGQNKNTLEVAEAILEIAKKLERGKGSVGSCLRELYNNFGDKPATVQQLIDSRRFSETTVRMELKMLEEFDLIDVDRSEKQYRYVLKSNIRNRSPGEIDRICAIPEMDRYEIPLKDFYRVKGKVENILGIKKNMVEGSQFDDIDALKKRIKEEKAFIDDFRHSLPAGLRKINAVPPEFLSECLENMFTKGHITTHKEKLYDEIFQLWQLAELAKKAKDRKEKTYYAVVNDARRILADGSTCTQLIVATPNREGSEADMLDRFRYYGLELAGTLNLNYNGIALSLYQVRDSAEHGQAVPQKKIDSLFEFFALHEDGDLKKIEPEYLESEFKKALKICETKLTEIHKCESNGIPGGIWNGIIFNYDDAEEGEFSLDGLKPSYRLDRGNIDKEKIHIRSVINPYLRNFHSAMKTAPDSEKLLLQTMYEMARGLSLQIKLEKGNIDAASQIKELLERIAPGLQNLGRDKGQSFKNWFKRITLALGMGYEIPEGQIELEKEKLFISFNRIKSGLYSIDGKLAEEMLREALQRIESSGHSARFALWEWIEKNAAGEKAERIAGEICMRMEVEEIAIEGMDEVVEAAKEQKRDIIVSSRDIINDELILRTFTEKYGIKAFVCCHGSTQQHTGILATASGAFLLVGLPEIVFDKLAKTGASASLVTSDAGFGSDFYIGDSRGSFGIEIAQKVVVGNVLKQYYMEKEKKRQESGEHTVETLDTEPHEKAKIPVYGNIMVPYHLNKGDFGIEEDGAIGRLETIYRHGANGIALARTEYMYTRETPPDSELQRDIYLGMADFSENPLTLRTFDKRDDKECIALPNLKKYSFDYYRTEPGREALKTQLKAMFGAYALSKSKNIRIMFPMIKTMRDIEFINEIISEIIDGENPDELPPMGIMAEHKEIFQDLNLEEILDNKLVKISFVSIGTNDLISSVKRKHRHNLTNADYDIQIMSLMERVVREASKRGISVSICGDVARFSKTAMFSVYLHNKYGIPLVPGVIHKMIPKLKTLIEFCNAENCGNLLQDWDEKTDRELNELIRTKTETIVERVKNEPEFGALFSERMKNLTGRDTDVAQALVANLFQSERANWIVRVLLSPGILIHELAHVAEGLISGRIKTTDLTWTNLFKGIPGKVRGSPALLGMIANLGVGLAGVLLFRNADAALSVPIMTISIINLAVLAIDIFLPVAAKKYRSQSDLFEALRRNKPGKAIGRAAETEVRHGIIIGVTGVSEKVVNRINKTISGVGLVALAGATQKANLEELERTRKTHGAYASGLIESGITDETQLMNIVEELTGAIEKEDRRLFALDNPEIASLTTETVKEIAGLENILARIAKRIPAIHSMRAAELSIYELRIDRISQAHQIVSRDALLAQKLAKITESGKTKIMSFRAHNIAEVRWLAGEHRQALQKYGKENYPVELHVRLVDENVTEKNLDRILKLAGVGDVITKDNITLADGETLGEICDLIREQFGEIEAEDMAIGDVRELKLDKELLKDVLYINMPASEGMVSQLYPVIMELIANENKRPHLMPQGVGMLEQPEPGLFYFIFKPIKPMNFDELHREIEQYERVLMAA